MICERIRSRKWRRLLRDSRHQRSVMHACLRSRVVVRFGSWMVSRLGWWWIVWRPSKRCGYPAPVARCAMRTTAVSLAKRKYLEDEGNNAAR